MPSASTTRPLAASAAIESSLCERTMPGSVQLAISSTCVRSIPLKLYIHFGSHRRAGESGVQCATELLASLEAVLRIFFERALQESGKSGWQVGPYQQDVGGRLVGDLEHKLGHGFCLERQPAGEHLIEAYRK